MLATTSSIAPHSVGSAVGRVGGKSTTTTTTKTAVTTVTSDTNTTTTTKTDTTTTTLSTSSNDKSRGRIPKERNGASTGGGRGGSSGSISSSSDKGKTKRSSRPSSARASLLTTYPELPPPPKIPRGRSHKGNKRETLHDIALRVTIATMRNYFNYPLRDAAEALDISVTTLKRLCRRHGVKRWPHRQLSGLNRAVSHLEVKQRGSKDPLIAKQLRQLYSRRETVINLAFMSDDDEAPAPDRARRTPKSGHIKAASDKSDGLTIYIPAIAARDLSESPNGTASQDATRPWWLRDHGSTPRRRNDSSGRAGTGNEIRNSNGDAGTIVGHAGNGYTVASNKSFPEGQRVVGRSDEGPRHFRASSGLARFPGTSRSASLSSSSTSTLAASTHTMESDLPTSEGVGSDTPWSHNESYNAGSQEASTIAAMGFPPTMVSPAAGTSGPLSINLNVHRTAPGASLGTTSSMSGMASATNIPCSKFPGVHPVVPPYTPLPPNFPSDTIDQQVAEMAALNDILFGSAESDDRRMLCTRNGTVGAACSHPVLDGETALMVRPEGTAFGTPEACPYPIAGTAGSAERITLGAWDRGSASRWSDENERLPSIAGLVTMSAGVALNNKGEHLTSCCSPQ